MWIILIIIIVLNSYSFFILYVNHFSIHSWLLWSNCVVVWCTIWVLTWIFIISNVVTRNRWSWFIWSYLSWIRWVVLVWSWCTWNLFAILTYWNDLTNLVIYNFDSDIWIIHSYLLTWNICTTVFIHNYIWTWNIFTVFILN